MKPTLRPMFVTAVLIALTANAQQPPQKAAEAKIREGKEGRGRRTLIQIAIQETVSLGDATLTKLGTLKDDGGTFNDRLDRLLSDKDGKRIAKDSAILFAFKERVYGAGKFPLDEVQTRTESVKLLVANLKKDLENLSDTYVPSAAFGDILKGHEKWATQGLAALAQRDAALTACIHAAPEVGEGESAPTLAEALKGVEAAELREFADIYQEVLARMQPERERQIRQATEEAETRRAEQDAEAVRRELQTKLDTQQHEHELAIARLQQERDHLRRELEQFKMQEVKVEAKHERDMAKQKLIERCKDAKVQQVLAPFLAEGYWQPQGRTTKKGPMSLKGLEAYGALASGDRGIVLLVKAVCDPDNDRPKWGLRIPNEPVKRSLERMTPEHIETANEAQRYLRELGPTLVELGMLAE